MLNPYLLLWFEGPLQSWGSSSRYGKRDTLPFPTRSGVMGILCAALGASGPQLELLADFFDVEMQILAFQRLLQNNVSILEDFQMVGAGYNSDIPWQSLLIPKTAEGKKAVGGGVKLTYRRYLQDVCFAVILELPQKYINKIPPALCAPVWDLSLGRKNCIPTEFIYQGMFETLNQATEQADYLAIQKKLVFTFKVLQGAHSGGDKIMTLNDMPIQFGENKNYRNRQVTLFYAKHSFLREDKR